MFVDDPSTLKFSEPSLEVRNSPKNSITAKGKVERNGNRVSN